MAPAMRCSSARAPSSAVSVKLPVQITRLSLVAIRLAVMASASPARRTVPSTT
jgi:hypothetical protein